MNYRTSILRKHRISKLSFQSNFSGRTVRPLENGLVDYQNYRDCNLVHPKCPIFVRSCEKQGPRKAKMHHISRRKHFSRWRIIWFLLFLFSYHMVTRKWSKISWDIPIVRCDVGCWLPRITAGQQYFSWPLKDQ